MSVLGSFSTEPIRVARPRVSASLRKRTKYMTSARNASLEAGVRARQWDNRRRRRVPDRSDISGGEGSTTLKPLSGLARAAGAE
jgi:hypothetical protein